MKLNLRRITLPADKANHVIFGFALGWAAAWLCTQAGYGGQAGPAAAMGALVAGAIKEMVDWLANEQARAAALPEPHTVDPVDAVATMFGGLGVWGVLAAAGA